MPVQETARSGASLPSRAAAAIKEAATAFFPFSSTTRKELSMSKTIAIRPVAAPAADAVQLTDEERQPCEVWTRVMGYHRPVASFNIGKQGEHAERRFFAEPAALGRCA
jgi:hypothetical protein